MANPQTEDGYTQIANELLEALMRTRISGEAMQVLLCIFRQTYGFNKKKDRIALSQFSLKTGMKRQHVSRAIKKLKEMNIISVTNNGYMKPCSFSIAKDFDKWKLVSKKVTSPIKVTKVTNKDSSVSPLLGHTKETITKDISKYTLYEKMVLQFKTNINKADLSFLLKGYSEAQLLEAGNNWHFVYFEGKSVLNTKERAYQFGKNKTKFMENIEMLVDLEAVNSRVEWEKQKYKEKYGDGLRKPTRVMGTGKSFEQFEEGKR